MLHRPLATYTTGIIFTIELVTIVLQKHQDPWIQCPALWASYWYHLPPQLVGFMCPQILGDFRRREVNYVHILPQCYALPEHGKSTMFTVDVIDLTNKDSSSNDEEH